MEVSMEVMGPEGWMLAGSSQTTWGLTCWDPLLDVDLELHVCAGVPPEEVKGLQQQQCMASGLPVAVSDFEDACSLWWTTQV